MRILNYGSLNIDHVYQVPHIVLPGETIHGGELKTHAGGKGANQSVALAKAGAEVWFAGKIGREARWAKDQLEASGVHTDLLREYDGPSGHTIIQVTPQGENSIILYGGGNVNNTLEEIEDTLSRFSAGDYLVLQNEINLIEQIMERAAARGLKICLNPAPFTDNIKSWPLETLELLIVNELEGSALAGIEGTYEQIIEALSTRYPNVHIIMTLGRGGSLYRRGDQQIHVPIIDAPVVDTTAAGDTYFGYLLAGMIEGRGMQQAMERATRASSITVSRPGAVNSIPYARELEQH